MSLEKIEHIIVLMQENRSFDSLLGRLYTDRKDFDTLSLDFYNETFDGKKIYVWNDPGTNSHPTHDPGENFEPMNQQIFDLDAPSNFVPLGKKPTMKGYVKNYSLVNPHVNPREVMHYYTPEQVPILSKLAKQYAVCDRWFASAPTSTTPNRFFVNTATAGGHQNNWPLFVTNDMPSIFSRFDCNDPNSWKVYIQDFSGVLSLTDAWDHISHIQHFKTFLKDAKEGNLPSYSFIEPAFYPAADHFEMDQHPTMGYSEFLNGIELLAGENLIGEIYNAVRSSPQWEKTLLVILYDESGGIFDHVPPPSAPMPEPPRPGQVFAFDRYGPRVPAILISPYIKPGTVFRAPKESQPFDHTSVISSLRKRFKLGAPLTNRDKHAPDFGFVLTEDQPTNNGPLVKLNELPTPHKEYFSKGVSELQHVFYDLAAHLPNLRKTTAKDHLKALKSGKRFQPKPPKTVRHAAEFVKEKVLNFLTHLEDVDKSI